MSIEEFNNAIIKVLKEEQVDDTISLDNIQISDDSWRKAEINIVLTSLVSPTCSWVQVLLKRISQVVVRMLESMYITASFADIKFTVNDRSFDSSLINATIVVSDKDAILEEKEKETMPTTMPKVVEIIHRTSRRGELFTVRWSDNTSTTVKRHDPDVSDEYSAFLFALGKKIFGNKGNARKFIAEKKAIFENRVAADSARQAEQKARMNMEKNPPKNSTICGYVLPVFDEDEIPCCVEEMVSRAIFKKNRR